MWSFISQQMCQEGWCTPVQKDTAACCRRDALSPLTLTLPLSLFPGSLLLPLWSEVSSIKIGSRFALLSSFPVTPTLQINYAVHPKLMMQVINQITKQCCWVTRWLQSVALACFQGFIKSFLGNSTGIQLYWSQSTYKLPEELLRKINRTSRNKLVPHSVHIYYLAIYPVRNVRGHYQIDV